jgi:hypothetical protein
VISIAPIEQSAPTQFSKHVQTIAAAPACHENAPTFAVPEREAPALVQRAATTPAAALVPCAAERNRDVGGAHGAHSWRFGALRCRVRRRCGRGCDVKQGASNASRERKVISVRRPTRTVSSCRSLINRHNVVLPSPLSFLAVATVTLRGFAAGASWSERPVLNTLTMVLRVRLQMSAEFGDEA